MNERALLAGIDAGGSRTVALVAESDGTILGRGERGPGNPHAVGFDQAARNVAEALRAGLDAADRPPLAVGRWIRCVIGMAGGGLEADRTRTRTLLESLLGLDGDVLHIVQDVALLLPAAGLDWGVALVAGTGSSAYAVAPDGSTAVAGGWGYLIGDDGSAYWIGRQALRAVARADDGYGAATVLTARVPTFLGVSRPRDVITAVYQAADARRSIASLAPLVTEAARHGDAVARGICDRAADCLAELVEGLARRLALPTRTPVVWAGGLTGAGDVIGAPLGKAIATRGAGTLRLLDREPAHGALQVAKKLA